MSRAGRAGILAAYRDGITVICELAAQFTKVSWASATPCTEWHALDLAGHLRCVADDYHEYLDDAPASRLARLMATGAPADSLARKLARQNSAELAALPDGPGEEHIRAFAESARAYGERLTRRLNQGAWDEPHHVYRGHVVTVGAMAGAACAEWHLHAWDLARTLGKDYRPADPALLFRAWRDGVPQLFALAGPPSAGSVQPPMGLLAAPTVSEATLPEGTVPDGTVPEGTVPEGTGSGGLEDDLGDPWFALLGASGRDPRWTDVRFNSA
jgi:hypothetical protein